MVQAGRGIQNHVPGGQLDAVRAVGILDHQFAAVVFVGRGEKQRRRKIGADPVRRAGHLADGVVHVGAEGLAALIAIEKRRKHAQGQRGGDEERILPQRVQNHLAQLARRGRVLRQLHIVFHAGRLMAGGHPAVDPFGLIEKLPCLGTCVGGQHIGYRCSSMTSLSILCRSKFEVNAHQSREPRSGHDVPGMDLIVVIACWSGCSGSAAGWCARSSG